MQGEDPPLQGSQVPSLPRPRAGRPRGSKPHGRSGPGRPGALRAPALPHRSPRRAGRIDPSHTPRPGRQRRAEGTGLRVLGVPVPGAAPRVPGRALVLPASAQPPSGGERGALPAWRGPRAVQRGTGPRKEAAAGCPEPGLVPPGAAQSRGARPVRRARRRGTRQPAWGTSAPHTGLWCCRGCLQLVSVTFQDRPGPGAGAQLQQPGRRPRRASRGRDEWRWETHLAARRRSRPPALASIVLGVTGRSSAPALGSASPTPYLCGELCD